MANPMSQPRPTGPRIRIRASLWKHFLLFLPICLPVGWIAANGMSEHDPAGLPGEPWVVSLAAGAALALLASAYYCLLAENVVISPLGVRYALAAIFGIGPTAWESVGRPESELKNRFYFGRLQLYDRAATKWNFLSPWRIANRQLVTAQIQAMLADPALQMPPQAHEALSLYSKR